MLKLGEMRFDYSHLFVSVNRVRTVLLIIFYETRLTPFLHLMFRFARDSNVYTVDSLISGLHLGNKFFPLI